MGNLPDALKKYNPDSSVEDIVQGLQNGGYLFGLNPATEQPIFQNYLTTLLNLKSNKELRESISSLENSTSAIEGSTGEAADWTYKLKKDLEKYNAQNSRQTKWLIILTWIIAGLTLMMAITALIQIF